MGPVGPDGDGAGELEGKLRAGYLNLLKGCLTRMLFMNDAPGRDKESLSEQRALRESGWDWPGEAETMIGMIRLNCIEECVATAVHDGVPGDLLEAGVWRGGAAIYMRALLFALGDETRTVWVADSFAGLPQPDSTNFAQDATMDLSEYKELAVSLEEVRSNFERYGMLDERVRFLKGWFKDTLAAAPIDRLAVLRLDGDYYESTIQGLEALYDKVSPYGFVIIDDYFTFEQCKQAVDDFRVANSIHEEIVQVDWGSIYWRKSNP
jgi:O-methyltransferase